MSTYLISYDISNEKEYNQLYEYIKSYGTYAPITESLWAVVTFKTAITIRNEILKIISSSAKLFVIKSGTESAWGNIISGSKGDEWLQKHL